MPDLQKVNDTKEKILSIIRTSGPSFPARIARETSVSPMFVAAFLSEMVSEKKLKLSNMRVGSSPIYLLPEQDSALENFVNYLNSKEREAFELLKKNKVLDDSAQDPAIRVALRKIKDFAIPLSVKSNNQDQLFWKYYLISDQDVSTMLQPPKKTKQEKPTEEIKKEPVLEPTLKDQVQSIPEPKIEKIAKEKKSKAPSKSTLDFLALIKAHLIGKEIEILQEISSKPKEFQAKVRIDTSLGKQEFFMTAKEKKKLTEDDLAAAIHRAQAEKMPALVLAKGELDKEAKSYLDSWKSMLKFEKLK